MAIRPFGGAAPRAPSRPRVSPGAWGGGSSVLRAGRPPKPAVGPGTWGGTGSVFGTGVVGANSPFVTGRPVPSVPPAAAPAASGTSGTQGDLGAPIDSALTAKLAALAAQRDTTITGLPGQRGNLLDVYGYTENPQGQLAFDASNPYSRAALLKRSYDQAQARTATQYGARQFSGAYQDTRNNLEFQRGQGTDALLKALTQALAANTQGAGQAATNYNLAASDAQLAAAGRVPTLPNYEPGSYEQTPPDQTAPTPASAPAAKPSATAGLVNVVRGYKSPSGRVGDLHVYADGRRVFVPR